MKKLQPNAIKDVHVDIIRTLDDSKDKMYFDKTFAKIRRLSGQEKMNSIMLLNLKNQSCFARGMNDFYMLYIFLKNIKQKIFGLYLAHMKIHKLWPIF